MSRPKKVLIIFNSQIKQNYFFRELPQIIHKLGSLNYDILVRSTQTSIDCIVCIQKNKHVDLLVVAGGDGTMNQVTNAQLLAGCQIPVLYFPIGTVNDLASTLKLKKNAKYLLNLVENKKLKKIDVGQINEQYFNYIASFGVFTSSSFLTKREDKQFFGAFAYVLEALKDVKNITTSYKLKLTVDGEIIEGEFRMALISNSRSVAGHRTMFKDVLLDDGYFQLVLVPKQTLESLYIIPKALIEGISENVDNDNFIYRHFKELTIEADSELIWNLDGEAGPVGNITIKVIEQRMAIYCDPPHKQKVFMQPKKMNVK